MLAHTLLLALFASSLAAAAPSYCDTGIYKVLVPLLSKDLATVAYCATAYAPTCPTKDSKRSERMARDTAKFQDALEVVEEVCLCINPEPFCGSTSTSTTTMSSTTSVSTSSTTTQSSSSSSTTSSTTSTTTVSTTTTISTTTITPPPTTTTTTTRTTTTTTTTAFTPPIGAVCQIVVDNSSITFVQFAGSSPNRRDETDASTANTLFVTTDKSTRDVIYMDKSTGLITTKQTYPIGTDKPDNVIGSAPLKRYPTGKPAQTQKWVMQGGTNLMYPDHQFCKLASNQILMYNTPSAPDACTTITLNSLTPW